MSWTIREQTNCRLCNGQDLLDVFNFGETALANNYLNKTQLFHSDNEFKAPLVVFKCGDCGSVQLRHTVNPEILYGNYLYESSTSAAFRKHFTEYASHVAKVVGLKTGDGVIDIGSNDYITLTPFKELGFEVLGVEPARNLAEKCNKAGNKTLNRFFGRNEVENCMDALGKRPKLVISNNCFAHIDDLKGIVEGVRALLPKEGVFVFENAYLLDTVKNLYFDQVYSDHLFYHSIKPLVAFFKKFGMSLYRVEKNKIQGGTIRCFVSNDKDKAAEPSVAKAIAQEDKYQLNTTKPYKEFNNKLIALSVQVESFFLQAKGENKTVCAFGAPAKFTTFCKVFNLSKSNIQCVFEDASAKQGLFTPGTHIPILPSSELSKMNPDYCIITAWNFAESIMKNNPDYKGKWVIPMPEFKII